MPGMKFEHDASLKPFNTFGIDAKARLFYRLKDAAQTRQLVQSPEFRNEKKLILGGGSNVLFTSDFDGLVVKNEIQGIDVIDDTGDDVLVKAGAGVVWHELVQFCVNHGFGGIENLSQGR